MSIVRNEMISDSRRPTHPGEVLREEFMPGYGLTETKLAALLSASQHSVDELMNERGEVDLDMALRLACTFATSSQYWMSLQRRVDLWDSFNLERD